jgi:hypothetical protein
LLAKPLSAGNPEFSCRAALHLPAALDLVGLLPILARDGH